MIRLKLSSGGRFMLAGSGSFLLASGITSSPTTMALVDFATSGNAEPIVQRKAGLTTGDVPVLFTYTGAAPSHPQARVVKAAGGVVVKDWTTLTAISANGTTGLGTLEGVPQGAGYLLQLRDGIDPTDGNTAADGATAWGVGVVVMIAGQSNPRGMLEAGSYVTTIPGTATTEYDYYTAGNVAGAIFDEAGWHVPSNGSLEPNGNTPNLSSNVYSFLRLVSQRLEALHGEAVPVGLIPWAYSNQGIEQFYGAGTYYRLFTNDGTDPGSVDIGLASPRNVSAGDFEIIIWHQGEANASDSSATYQTRLQTLYQSYLTYVAPFGRTAADLYFAPSMLGNYGPSAVPAIQNIRQAIFDFEAYADANGWPCVQIGLNCIDQVRVDGLHMNEASYKRSMKRVIQSVLYFTGCASFSGRGPELDVTPTRAGLEVTFDVIHEGGTGLVLADSGAAPSGFTATNGTGALSPTVALVNGNTQIKLTFSGGTTFPVSIQYMAGENPDTTNCIYDNVTYPTGVAAGEQEALGLPLLPTAGVVIVN